MELVIEPHHRTLAVEPGATLLDVLRDNGIPVSYSCMAGRCGTCRCKVVAGSVLETGRETKPRGAEEGGGGEVNLADHAVVAERDDRDGGEVVEVGVAVAGLLEEPLGLDQLQVLNADLFLLDLKLVEELWQVGRVGEEVRRLARECVRPRGSTQS